MQTKAKILLAEDDEYLRELVQDALEDEDYQVTACVNGQEAIDLFDKTKFPVIVSPVVLT